jgi:hypothetical protein
MEEMAMQNRKHDSIPYLKADREAAVIPPGSLIPAAEDGEGDEDEPKRLDAEQWETSKQQPAIPMLPLDAPPPVAEVRALPPEPAHLVPPANGKPGRVAPAKPFRFSPAPAKGGATKHTKRLVKLPR